MLEQYFHCDGYRLANEIAENYGLDKEEVLDKIEEYLGYYDSRDLAIPVWFDILLEEYQEFPIAKYMYEILAGYFDTPTGKVYIDF